MVKLKLELVKIQVFQKNGFRHNTSTAFLKPSIKRNNLKVISGVLVDKLIIEQNRVLGVNIINNNMIRGTVNGVRKAF